MFAQRFFGNNLEWVWEDGAVEVMIFIWEDGAVSMATFVVGVTQLLSPCTMILEWKNAVKQLLLIVHKKNLILLVSF